MSSNQANELGYLLMSLLRAIESTQPDDQRLFNDPVSRRIQPWYLRPFLLPGLRQLLVAVTELRGPGAYGNLVCRTRYIDDVLLTALADGLDQVVILGAGFDWRPYRIPGIDLTRVFEVDLPEVQAIKQKYILKTYSSLPAHVTLVPVDFDEQNLPEQLGASGFKEGQRTFFVWEGVTQYITEQAVDSTLRFISSVNTSGSKVVFTYIHRGIIDGYERSVIDKKMLSIADQGGVPWVFGFEPSEIEPYLAARGLKFLEEAWTPVYIQRYLQPVGREMEVFAGERMVQAAVGL